MSKKIRILSILTLICALIALLTLTACDPETATPETATVSLSYNAKRGTVTATPPADGSTYAVGEEVTVTAVPNETYRVQSVKLNGEEIELEGDSYTFTLDGDVTVEVTFTPSIIGVYLTYAETKGSVTLSPELPEGKQYDLNDEVTVTVTPNNRCVVRSVTLNGKGVTLENNSFTLTVSGRMNVVVDFAGEALGTQLYSTLKGRVRFDGDYRYDATDDERDLYHLLETTFGQDSYIHQRETDPLSDIVYYDQIYMRTPNNASRISLKYLNLNNEVVVVDSNDLYSAFANPFDFTLEASDFELCEVTEDGFDVYELKNPTLSNARKAASALTGWNEPIVSFKVYFKDGVACRLVIVTDEVYINMGGKYESFTYVSTYDFGITDIGTAVVEEIRPFQYDEVNHPRLEAALAKADGAERYTIRHQAHEIGYDSEDIDYFKYVTEDLFFSNYPGWEYGHKLIDGYVYPFSYNALTNHVTLDDPLNVDSIAKLQATFTLSAKAELFKYVGDNTFILQNAHSFAPYIVRSFGEGTDEPKWFQYATSLSIVLDGDGDLYQIKFTYTTYGITENVVLTYDFDSEVDLSFLDFDDADKNSVLDPFVGYYEDENGNFAVVDMYGFKINGYGATVTGYDKETGTFVATWQKKTIYIRKFSQKQLLVYDDGVMYWVLNSVYDSSVTVPEQFKGHWFRANADLAPSVQELFDTDFDFVVQTHCVILNGVPTELLSYTLSEGIVASLDGVTYSITIAIDEDGVRYLAVLILSNDGETAVQIYAEYVDGNVGVEIPEQYVGTFINEDTDTRVDITYTAITVNGEKFTPTAYSEDNGFVGTLGNATDCTIKLASDDCLQMGGQQLKRINTILRNYTGTWVATFGFSQDNPIKPYKLLITDTGITFIRYGEDGEVLSEDAISADGLIYGDKGYELHVAWSSYTVYLLYTMFANDSVPMLYIFDNNELFCSLSKQGQYDTDIVLSDGWDGIYTGRTPENELIAVTVSTDDSTLFIAIDSTEQQALLVEYDSDSETLEIEYDGTTYYLFLDRPADGKLTVTDGEDVEIVLTKHAA